MGERIDRERSRARIERDIETLGGPAYTLSESAICRYAYTRCVPRDARLLHRGARAHRILGLAGPGRHADRLQRGARRARVRRRVALRLQPQRRQVRRHARRLHGARGLPPGHRGGRGAPPAPDLVPRGGGLRLRPDAARLAHHAAAGDRGGAARDVPRRAWRVVLGFRRGRRLRAGALARVDPRARRPDRLGRGAHRAGARPAGHRQPARDRRGDRRLHPRRPALPRPGGSRGSDADGLPPRRGGSGRGDDRRAGTAGATSSAATSSARWARSRCSRT